MVLRYKEYKDSGIDWIDEIPSDWQVMKLKQLGVFSTSGIDKKTLEGEVTVKMVNYTDIYGNQNCELNNDRDYMIVSCPQEKKRIHQVEKGDLIFTPSSETVEDIGLSALINEYLPDTVYSYHVIRFQFKKPVSHTYKKYLCNNNLVLNQFSKCAKGTTRQILGRDDFKNIQVMLPSDGEQQKTSIYLDHKTTQIDDLIAKKERMIEFLKEERIAIINQAVTRGLDETVEFKDSGIEWLGEIPKHWEMKELRYLIKKIGSGVTPKGGASVYQLEGVLFLRSQNIHFDGLRLDDVAYISEDIHEDMSGSKVLGGDVLLNITGASIGRCYYYPENLGEANVNQHVCIVRPNKFAVTKYLTYCLSSEVGQQQIINSQNGISREGLNFEELGAFKIPIPDINEQKKIVGYLDKKTRQIDEQSERENKSIELLKEYRTALISEVVTGKIDVRSET